ncbi:MAG: hypothetical protein A4E49_03257 [Methanosaeta sp. PtaU1.Bin112]|nr:MAG: hypothetical protein A4E49_03257 [Methanosaeta sp. PtaU1.Bin112]
MPETGALSKLAQIRSLTIPKATLVNELNTSFLPWLKKIILWAGSLESPSGRNCLRSSLYAVKADVGSYNWLSECKQTPILREDILIPHEHFRSVEVLG